MNGSMDLEINNIKKSYGRVLFTREQKQRFFNGFYGLLLASNDEIKAMFANTNFDKQTLMLKNAISMAIMYVENEDSIARDFLVKIRKTHARDRMNIKPEYYDYWMECLIQTLWECDPQFSDALESGWRKVMGKAIEVIREGY